MFLHHFVSIALFILSTNAAPSFSVHRRASSFSHQNGLDAQAANNDFGSLSPDSSCTEGTIACVTNQFAQCVGGKFVLTPCGGDLICAVLPLVNSPGTSTTCTTTADRDARIENALGNDPSSSSAAPTSTADAKASPSSTMTSASASSTSASGTDSALQSSTTLDPSVIAQGFNQNGLNLNTSEPGQVASLTSTNNFINFCATTKLPITNGKQIKTGSCNPAPMGVIAATTNMPACKFVNPPNMGTIKANTNFTITMAIKNLETGNFVNAQSNYYSAPQQVNNQGNIIGHSHFVIEALQSLTQTTPLDNTKFAFFQGVNTPADNNGQLHVTVNGGLPKGVYRLASINAAANHQPTLVAVAQHGSLDDMVYFTVE